MIRTLTKTWWLLALCSVLDAIQAAMNLVMLNMDGSAALRRFAPVSTVWDMSVLAVAAGACVIAAGLWSYGKDNSWLLALHGLALSAFGLIGLSPLVKGPLSFRPVSLLFIVMSVTIAVFGWRIAQPLASAISIGFACSFLVVGFGFVSLGPQSFWIWMSSYFAFCAIFMLWLSVHLCRQTESLRPLRSPRHAH